MTLDQLADKSGVNRGTIHRIETDEVSPRIDTLEAICRALGVKVEELFRNELDRQDPVPDEVAQSGSFPGPAEPDPERKPGEPRDLGGIRQGLLEWAEHLEAILHESQDMLAVLDPEGYILFESWFTVKTLGTSRGLRSARSWWEWAHEEDRQRVVELFREVCKPRTPPMFLEYRMRYKNGNWHWIRSVFSNQLQHPMIRGVLVNSIDITPDKELEFRLVEREQRLRSILQSVPDRYLRLDGMRP